MNYSPLISRSSFKTTSVGGKGNWLTPPLGSGFRCANLLSYGVFFLF